MTFLLAHATPGAAQLVTDSICYERGAAWISLTSKVLTLPHARIMIASSGESWISGALNLGLHDCWRDTDLRSFDDVGRVLPPVLRRLWEGGQQGGFSDVYVLGYSPTQGQHQGLILCSDSEFEPVTLEGGAASIVPGPAAGLEQLPSSVDAMVELVESIREEQISLPPGNRTLIGGHLMVTSLRGYDVDQTMIHEFDDSPELWARYLDGVPDADASWMTRHPGTAGATDVVVEGWDR